MKRWRNHRGLTQEELAERADLHRTYISDVERGARNLSLESIDKLARALEISLPILFSPDATPGAYGHAPEAGATEMVEILLVENNPREVDVALDAFMKMRLANSVRVVGDGAEALDLFFKGSFAHNGKVAHHHVVLLDLDLPKVSGLEVLRQLKADKRTSGIPVVIIAASDKHGEATECKRLGAAAVIAKPLSSEELKKVSPALNLVWALVKPPSASGMPLATDAP